jgi:hypothetical protein
MWVLASIPFWLMGFFLLFVGAFAVGKVAFSEEGAAFKSATDGEALKMGSVMVFASGGFLIMAAHLAS